MLDQIRARDLVKVRFSTESNEDMLTQIDQLAQAAGATLAGRVGSTALLYRPIPEPEELPS